MRIKALVGWIKKRAVMLLAILSVGGITAFVTLFQLESLMPGANVYEVQTNETLRLLSQEPLSNPINLPYYLLVKLFTVFTSDLLAQRLASALLGIAMVGLLTYVLRQWFNNRIAIVGALLLATSSWYLALSRTGAPFVVAAFWLSLFFAIGTWRTYTRRPLLTDALIAVALALSLYTPYYVWLAVVGLIVLTLRRKKQLFVLPRKHQWILPGLFTLFIAPLLIAIVREPHIARELAGLQTLPASFMEFVRQIGQNIAHIFFRGFSDPALSLGRLPLLDIFSAVMVALGILYFERQRDLRRSQILFGAVLVLGVAVSITSFAVGKLSIFFPIIMIFAVAGIVELLNRWLKSFPRNPIARTVGVCVIVVAIGFTSQYHLQRYFVAWSGNPDAIAAHSTDLSSVTIENKE